MDSSVAPAEDEAATLTTIPGDALGVVQQFIGFHSSPAVSAVSTSLYKTEELAAARARQRLSLAAMPSLPSGPRDLRDRRLATEYLSLVPTTEGAQSRTIICAENYHCDDEQSLAAVLQRSCTRCVLRTSTDQGCKDTFIVEINKDAGEVLVYEHPDRDSFDYDRRSIDYDQTPRNLDWVMQRVNLDEMTPLERYEAVGVFVGICCIKHYNQLPGPPKYGDSILLQLPVADHKKPQYEYVQIGDRCRRFATPEPLTRYFAHVGNNHANMEVALSERYVYFPFFDRSGTVMYAPRSDWRFRSREQGPPYYEGAWEACYEWDVAGNNRQRLPSDNRHGGSNYNPDLSPAPSDHSDSDSDSEGDVEGVHWEWSRPNPFMGGRRYKIMLSQRERRKRRRAARTA